MDRTLDLGGVRGRPVEIARAEDGSQQRRKCVVVPAQQGAEFCHQCGRRVIAHEVTVELGGDEPRGHVLVQNDVDDLDPAVGTGPAQKGLDAGVVQFGLHDEVQPGVRPARERARGFADVRLGIIADAHREQFQDLAAEILVRAAFDVLAGVQIDEHGRVPGDPDEQVAEIPVGVFAEEIILLEQLAVVAHLRVRGRKVAVPEQRQLFLERARGDQHPLRPPLAGAPHFEQVRPQPIEEAVDDRLQRPVAAGFDAHAHRLAVGARDADRFDAALGKRIEARVEDAGLLERRHVAVVHALIFDQVAHRGLGRHRRQPVDLLRRTAEAGPLQQVGGAVAAPFRGRNRRQVARPTRRPGAQRRAVPGRLRPRAGREQEDEQADGESARFCRPAGSARSKPFHWCSPPTLAIYSPARGKDKAPENVNALTRNRNAGRKTL